jgi:hypothetical protein
MRKKSVLGKPSMRILPAGCGTVLRFFYSTLRVSRSVVVPTLKPPPAMPAPPDRIRPSSSRNNCRSSMANIQAGQEQNEYYQQQMRRAQRPGWRSPHPRSTGCARKYLLDLWRRVPYNPISLSEKGNTNSPFSFRCCCGCLAHEIHKLPPSIHSLLCSLLATSPLGSSFIITISFFSVS